MILNNAQCVLQHCKRGRGLSMIWDKFQRVSPRNRTNEPANSPSSRERMPAQSCNLGIDGLQAFPVACG